MKIGFIEPHVKYGIGGIRRIIEVSNRLISFGHSVTIFTPEGKPCTWIENNIPTKSLDTIKNYSFDVSVFNLSDQYKIALQTNAKRRVFWVLAPEALYKNPKVPLESINQNFHFVVNSSYTKHYLTSHRKVKLVQKDIHIIPAGINPQHFKLNSSIAKECDVLYFGSNRPWKGTAFVESALLGMKGIRIVKMFGKNTPQSEMHKLYNKSHLYVSAAMHEGFSMTQLEAMACGCAVITTDDGGSRDYVRNGYNAIVIKRAHFDLRSAILRLLANTKWRSGLVCNGVKTAADSKFNWDNVAKQFEKAISD